MSNEQLDRQIIAIDRQQHLRFKFRLLQNFSGTPKPKRWLLKNLIAANETSSWIAPPGRMKSALLGELAFAVATQQDWHGFKAKVSGSVVYFALERADLVDRRLRAYLERSGRGEAPPIALVRGLPNLMREATVKEVVATIRAVEAETGVPAVLVIFDTFAKLIAAGGGDEDKARDQGAVFANLQRLKDEIGVHVAIVGHTGKDETRGQRGSNTGLGDADIEVRILGDEIKTATIFKANDLPEGPLFSFKSAVHDFGRDEDGDPITVNIVSGETLEAVAEQREHRLSKNQQTVFGLLHDAGSTGLLLEDWNAQARAAGIGVKRPADLVDIRSALRAKALVREYGGRWKVAH